MLFITIMSKFQILDILKKINYNQSDVTVKNVQNLIGKRV